MKNILLAFVCLLTMSFKGIAGNGDPKCCTSKCSKECIEMCKKNNCTDKDCCKLCDTKGCQGTACKDNAASCCKKADGKVALTTNANSANTNKTSDVKAGSCCAKGHK
jgi:hypothetical protein